MAKRDQVLLIEPQYELKFRGPFTNMITSYLKLTNPTDSKVCFKIKTTAPRKYCVRPNSGIVEPKGVMEIAVCLQPFDYDPNEKNKHKFMVQTMLAPDTPFNQDSLWKEASPDVLMDTKLKCVFELPVDSFSGEDTETAPAEETRAIGDTPSNQDGEVPKVKKLKHIQDEENLRQENFKLKEEMLQMQKQMEALRSHSVRYDAPTPISLVQPPLIIITVIMTLVGIFLGKFLL